MFSKNPCDQVSWKDCRWLNFLFSVESSFDSRQVAPRQILCAGIEMSQQFLPWQASHHNSVFSHHNPMQDWLPYCQSQPIDMQTCIPAPAARNSTCEQFPINQSSAVPYNSNIQFGNLSYDTILKSQPIVTQPIDTQTTGVLTFQGPVSYAGIVRQPRNVIVVTNQFYAKLNLIQEKNLGKRAKHWGITGSEEQRSQETFQMIVERLAQPERSSRGIRLQRKVVATTTSVKPRKRRRIPRRGQRSSFGDSKSAC